MKVISIFSFLGISLGVAILIIVMSVMNGFRTDLTNKILGLNPHIIIDANGYIIDDSFRENLKKKYQNLHTSSSFTGEGIVFAKDNAKGILIKGVKLGDITKSLQKYTLIEGNYKNFKDGTVLIGTELAFNLDLKVNDRINLMSSAFIETPIGSIPKQESLKIAGIFNSGFNEFDQNLIFLSLNNTLSIFDKSKKDINLEIYLEEPLKADIYKKEIQEMNENFFVYSWSDQNKSFFSALKVERNVMFIILTLIIIVAAFNIISGLTILIKNKTKEIAILKTLGLSNSSIKRSFFLTGFSIGLSATLFGILLGVGFSLYIEEIRIFLSTFFNLNIFPPDVYFLEKMPSELNVKSIFFIFIFSLIITSIASFFPARAITKMKTTDALKYE